MSSPRVLITLDPNKLLSAGENQQSVEVVTDYIPACLAIRNALRVKQKRSLELLIHQNTVGIWLREWVKGYDPNTVKIRSYTACDALRERWGIEIPSEYERDIVRSGLLDVNVTPREGQSFENVVLETFYHDFFAYPRFPVTEFARLLNQANSERWIENNKRPIVFHIYRLRINQWIQNETNESRKELINRLSRDLSSLRESFAAYKVLKGYPLDLAEKILGNDYDIFRRSNVDPERLSLQDIDLTSSITEIEYYLNQHQSSLLDPEDFYLLLSQMSGQLLAEFNFVEHFLSKKADWLTAHLMRQIERRFSSLRSGITSRLNRMRELIVVDAPPAPKPDWNPDQWLNWVANQYMPHHRWLEIQRRYDETAAQNAIAFADWYYENFSDLKNGTPQHFAFSTIYEDRSTFLDNNKIALVILLDNFNYSFFPELRRLFNQRDVSLSSERPVFSLPPSATEVGKASLVAITGDLTEIPTPDYGKLVEEVWNKVLASSGKTASYIPSLGDLQSLSDLKHALYFLNYLPVDEALHGSSKQIGLDHANLIHNLLEKLVDSVVEFAHRFNIEKRLVVYIVSDHGSTRIGKDVVNILHKKFYNYIADKQHHRYMTLSDEQLESVPQAVEAQCYIINRKKFKTHANYLAARAYYRFVETNDDYYVHGGLTPEEIVVPFARFIFQPLNITAPTLRLLKDQFRYSVKSIVEYELGNPNDFPLENLSVRLADSDAEEVFADELPAKATIKIAFQTIFRKEPKAGNSRDLSVFIQFECQERTFEPVQKTDHILLKGMMEIRDDFEF